MMFNVWLTTTDNSFDPFTEFDKWEKEDERLGYFTLSYLTRIAKDSNELSDEERESNLEKAIDEICRINITGKYRKVTNSV